MDVGSPEKILDQLVIEHLLSSVGAKLCVWLKDRKPTTAEELAMLANEYVQIRKGPITGRQSELMGIYDKSKVTCFHVNKKLIIRMIVRTRTFMHQMGI